MMKAYASTGGGGGGGGEALVVVCSVTDMTSVVRVFDDSIPAAEVEKLRGAATR
jgi:hypothetical protein